jgi:hypothetical protein
MIGVDTALQLGLILVAIIVFVSFVNVYLIPSMQHSYKRLLIEIPLMEGYTLDLYNFLLPVAVVFFTIVAILSALVLIGEMIELFPKETAFRMFIFSIIGVVLAVVFPDIYNGIALMIQTLSEYILENTPYHDKIHGSVAEALFRQIGGFGTLNRDSSWLDAVMTLLQGNAIDNIFRDVLMVVFRAVIAGLLAFLMYVLGTIRFVLTGVLAISFPILFALHQIPLLKRVTSKLIDTFIGLMIAPFLSALVLVAGVGFLLQYYGFDPNNPDFSTQPSPKSFETWLASVSVALLALSIPLITAPVLGSIMTQATTIATGALLSSLYSGVSVAKGVASGIAGTVKGLTGSSESSFGLSSKALTYAKGIGLGMLSGIGETALKQVTDAVPEMSKVITPVIGKGMEGLQTLTHTLSRRIAERSFSKHLGSAIDATMTAYMHESLMQGVTNADITLKQSKALLDRLTALENTNDYAKVADLMNSNFFKLSHVPDKEGLGKAIMNYVNSVARSDNALIAWYDGMNRLANDGGLPNLTDTIDDYMILKPSLKGDIKDKVGKDLPSFDTLDKRPFTVDPIRLELEKVQRSLGTVMVDIKESINNRHIPNVIVPADFTQRKAFMEIVKAIDPDIPDHNARLIAEMMVNEVQEYKSADMTITEINQIIQAKLDEVKSSGVRPTVSLETIKAGNTVTDNGKLLDHKHQ